MTTKLTPAQRKALEHAADGNGLVQSYNSRFSVVTLRNLADKGLLKRFDNHNYEITAAGLEVLGRGNDLPLVNLMIWQVKWQRESQRIHACGKMIRWDRWDGSPTLEYEYYYPADRDEYWIYRRAGWLSETLDAAIELTRAEMRAGLV